MSKNFASQCYEMMCCEMSNSSRFILDTIYYETLNISTSMLYDTQMTRVIDVGKPISMYCKM